MIQRGRRIAIVGLLWLALLTHCFNLEPGAGSIYSYPYADTQGRESYFGYSVALQHVESDNTDWLIVGAPRANSSFFNENEIQEPGAVFRCPLTSDTCEELRVDNKGNEAHGKGLTRYTDLKNYGWLGGSLDSQPKYTNYRQATCICAPLWKDQYKKDIIYMNGACYLSYDPISNATNPFAKEVPLANRLKQVKGNTYLYAYGQAGFSVHFPDDSAKLIVGTPGLLNWTGSVILFEDENESSVILQRKKRDVNHDAMFLFSDVPTTDNIEENSLFGYSVSSGNFRLPDVTHYAAGAPHAANSLGKVFIFEFGDEYKLLIKDELKGDQMGEYFGGALVAADINCDGQDDLVVGSPTYSDLDLNIPDIGRIHTFLSIKGTLIRSAFHYGNKVKSFARFGTTLASLGDLNADACKDIVVGAPWEGDGAVYVFLGSPDGLKDKFSQRLSPENFTPGVKGFGMAISRGIDIDNNGYPDLAIGNFLSGHALVVKSRPVVILSGKVIPNPASVIWEEEKNIILKTCLHYEGYRSPTHLTVQTKLILDHGSASIRAVFTDGRNTSLSDEVLVFDEEKCTDYEVTVKEDKINPNLHIIMRLEYKLVDNPVLELVEKPVTDPTANNYTMGYVGIVKDCVNNTICKVDLRTKAFIDGTNYSVVIGKMNKLRVEVSNIGEAAYLPTMNITADPRLLLIVPVSHECTRFKDDTKASVECLLPNPIKNDSQPHIVIVDVMIDESKVIDNIGQMKLHINVNGEGKEMNAGDNNKSMILQPATEANLTLIGSSEEEQVPYKLTEDKKIIVTNNARFNHSYILYKKGPTSLTHVDLILDIPVNFTDGSNFVKVHNWKFIGKSVASFVCHLSGINLANDSSSSIISTSDASVISDAHSSSDIQAVSAEKEADAGVQYFNCSSNQIKCAQLYCRIQGMMLNTQSAKVLVELEVDLKILAKHISVKGGANFGSKASATIQSSNLQMVFIGLKHTEEEVVTYIQPETLLSNDFPWWVIILALLGGGLILGAVTYGLYKKGFFKRETLKELKAQQASLNKPIQGGVTNTFDIE